MRPYDRDSSTSVCISGLREDCGGSLVSDATVKAAIFAPDQTTMLSGDVDVPPVVGEDGSYKGVIPVTDVSPYEFVYIRLNIDKGAAFQTRIWDPRVVRDRPANS